MAVQSIDSVENLAARMRAGYQPEFLFFWGHQPAADGSIGKQCLSQWWDSPFELGGVHYATAEHFMMAGKARLFGDDETLQKILRAHGPKAAKALGRGVRGFVDSVWEEKRVALVLEGNRAKFGQNADLRAFLLGTGERVLAEASPLDAIWGIGLEEDDPAARLPERWRGLNLLGFALMRVRQELLSM